MTGRDRLEPPDLSEKGGLKGGVPQRSDERLFMQLMAFGECRDVQAVSQHLAGASMDGVVYEDLNDPQGVAVLALAQDPAYFLDVVRPLLKGGPFAQLRFRPDTRCSAAPTRSGTSQISRTRSSAGRAEPC